MKIAESYSVIVIPKDRSRIRRWVVSRDRILAVFAVAGGFAVFTLAICFGFLHYQKAYFATSELRERGQRYERERVRVLSRLEELETVINKNEQLVSRLESVVGIHSVPGITVGTGGEKSSPFQLASINPNRNTPRPEADLFDETTLRAYNLKAIDMVGEAKEVGERLNEVYQFHGEAEYFWSAYPSVVPVKGWITSDFGLRRSPMSGHRQLHEGVDIASPYGSGVVATGDGVVTFAGRQGGLGKKLVIDHGYGLASVYGHNSEILVSEGERVRRGQLIAKIGSTGRSTGPHLHYEILVNGIPVDPKRFLLEQL